VRIGALLVFTTGQPPAGVDNQISHDPSLVIEIELSDRSNDTVGTDDLAVRQFRG